MAADLADETFTIIDEMYNHLKQQKTDPEVFEVLMKAGTALNKKVPFQIVAAKTVNGITLISLTKKLSFDEFISHDISCLRTICRAKGYQWSGAGISDLRIQF